VGFTNTNSSPNKKRIVGKSGIFYNSLGGGISKIITVANNQVFKGVTRVKIGGGKIYRIIFGLVRKKRGVGSAGGVEINDVLDNEA